MIHKIIQTYRHLIGNITKYSIILLGGVTPLHRACYSGHSKIAIQLLKNGANPEITDQDGMTSLHKVTYNHMYTMLFIIIIIHKASNNYYHTFL